MTENKFEINDKVRQVIEGKTTIFVPITCLDSNIPPRTPAFYNLYAKMNRDISIVIYRVFANYSVKPVIMSDSLAGVGARGVRVAVEAPEIDLIYINDINPIAIKLARKSARVNKVAGRCKFTILHLCQFLSKHSAPKRRFNILDIDPFGSPAPFLDCALRAVENGGLLSATATDMAVLCGVYPRVSYRKYYGHSLNTEYCHEIGARLLLGAIAHNAIRLDLGITPVFVHRIYHYFRVYVIVHISSYFRDRTYSQIGYIHHCFKCGYRSASIRSYEECPKCKSMLKKAGPLWIGKMFNEKFLTHLAEDCHTHIFRQGLKIVNMAIKEADLPPTYYNIDKMSSELGVATPSLESIILAATEEGYHGARSTLDFKGIKTNMPLELLYGLIKKMSNNHRD